MLSAALRRGVSVCSNGLRTYARGRRTRDAMPGLQHRASVMEKEGVTLPQGVDLEEFLEESEADMHQIHKLYDHYEVDQETQRERLKRNIVRQKYWDESTPNLLTWSEKEQIRYLINECGDEWTPERVEESFPITADAAKKIAKYSWKPATQERIARHDASALRNWKELKEGTLDIPEELRQRFLKFSNRTIPPLRESSVRPDISPKLVGEFQAIIEKSAAKERERAKSQEKKEDKLAYIEDNNKEIATVDNKQNSKSDKKRYTLDELKYRIGEKLSKGKEVSTIDKHLLMSEMPVDDAVAEINTIEKEIEISKDNHQNVAIFKQQNIEPVNVPHKIEIPKAAYKPGGTYRVNDCYYDHDGEFLYRVPGKSEVSGIKQ